MYTVKELIEALEKCPIDYEVMVLNDDEFENIESVGINNENKTVNLLFF